MRCERSGELRVRRERAGLQEHAGDDPSAADIWNSHVLTELLEPWSKMPYFVSGFSGGAALGLERNSQEKEAKLFPCT